MLSLLFSMNYALDLDSAEMYAIVLKEHIEEKKKKKLSIQRYDDIHLLPLELQDRAPSAGSQFQGSNTAEVKNTDYSRLCHAGPRMSQTRKHMYPHPDGEHLQQDGKKSTISHTKDDHSYSEVLPTTPNLNITATGRYSQLNAPENDGTVPPPLPAHCSMYLTSMSPVKSMQKVSSSADVLSSVEVITPAPYLNQPITSAQEQSNSYSFVQPTSPDKDFSEKGLKSNS